jgi:hypothetical protein
MRKSLVLVLASSLIVLGAACSSAPDSPSTGSAPSPLTIAASSSTSFDATYTAGGVWAHARVAYTPSTTMYEITTSHGTVVVRTGTAIDGRAEASRVPDPRAVEGVVHVGLNDAERPVLSALLDSLLAAGASAHPTRVQAGSTLYAAAFFTASALGYVTPSTKPGDFTKPTIWPYPGYYSKDDMPPELKVADGLQNGSGGTPCCGPFTCYNADWNPNQAGGCDDWCAAGDACNAWGWSAYGGCGTAFWWPSGGCNSCPHSDSGAIKTYDYYGHNTGTCSVNGYDPTPSHYGPASNFDYYGNYYFGSGGGEYGSGPNDHW